MSPHKMGLSLRKTGNMGSKSSIGLSSYFCFVYGTQASFLGIFFSYVTPAVVVIPLMTAKSSVCWNPVIYVAMNPQVSSFTFIVITKHF